MGDKVMTIDDCGLHGGAVVDGGRASAEIGKPDA